MVAMLSDSSHEIDVEIRFAPVRPLPNPQIFKVTNESLGPLKLAASILRELGEEPSQDRIGVSGSVLNLRRPTRARRGQVVIEEVGGERRVKVELDEPDYQLAVRAHAAQAQVRVLGVLTKRTRSWVLHE